MNRNIAVVTTLAVGAHLSAQVIPPPFDTHYSIVDLGTPAGVPSNFGGLTFAPGDTSNLIIGGGANGASGALYRIGVVRDATQHITGFSGTATLFVNAPYNDGGVVYGPANVLFCSRWPVNELGQYVVGATDPTTVTDLAALGVASSHSALNFVPPGFPAAGAMKLSSWAGGQFYHATFVPNASGTFDVTAATETAILPGGPEGFIYLAPGSPLVTVPSLLVSEFSAGIVSIFDIDQNADPIIESRRVLVQGLGGAEGAYIDPETGDFMFSTFGGGSRVVIVRGFVPPPIVCDSIDFNNDGLFPDVQDIQDFLTVFGGGPCPATLCNDLDYNNDNLFPDAGDIDSLISIFAGGECIP